MFIWWRSEGEESPRYLVQYIYQFLCLQGSRIRIPNKDPDRKGHSENSEPTMNAHCIHKQKIVLLEVPLWCSKLADIHTVYNLTLHIQIYILSWSMVTSET